MTVPWSKAWSRCPFCGLHNSKHFFFQTVRVAQFLTYLALCKEVGGQDIQVNQLKTLESPTALPSPHSSPGLQEGTKLDLSQAPCGTQ